MLEKGNTPGRGHARAMASGGNGRGGCWQRGDGCPGRQPGRGRVECVVEGEQRVDTQLAGGGREPECVFCASGVNTDD
jgi:hypothetical protein